MKTQTIKLNAEKRKIIADQFQDFYEEKVKQKLTDAKTTIRSYSRKEQKNKIEEGHKTTSTTRRY